MSSSSPPLTPPTSDSESERNEFPTERTEFPFVSSSQSRTLPLSTSSPPHPFAASTKANRAPPLYEKKVFTSPTTHPELMNIPSVKTCELHRNHSCALFRALPSPVESEQTLWDVAISSAVDGAKAKLDLSGCYLTYIPPHILDLKNLVVLSKATRGLQTTAPTTSRSFKRSVTAPAHSAASQVSRRRPFLATTTTDDLRLIAAVRGKPLEINRKCEIELYLMRNAIRVLPRELFGLDCLVVLSLRQNLLTSLPPAIGQLTCLRELNVANNRLEYLPAEILKLNLTSLNLHPNPFMSVPPNLLSTRLKRRFAPLERKSSVPALSEIMLRFLLAPATSNANSATRLETSMTQSLDSLPLPDHFQRIVRASTGHALASEKGTFAEDDMTANVCPNPDHLRPEVLRGSDVSDISGFHTPVEAMMEWVRVVAGVQVAESPQARVPVLWRGCSKGCLAFLQSSEEEEELPYVAPIFGGWTVEGGDMFEFSDDE